MPKDYTGIKYGKLIALRHIPDKIIASRRVWEWRCDCGKIITRSPHDVIASAKRGCVPNCGCSNTKRLLEMNAGKKSPWSAKKAVYARYKSSAEHRGFIVNISFDEFIEIVTRPCAYCGAIGATKTFSKAKDVFLHNGIDRVDSAKGYEFGNMVPCCKTCNYAKRTMTAHEYINHCRRVADYIDTEEIS